MFKLMVKKLIAILAENVCLTGPMKKACKITVVYQSFGILFDIAGLLENSGYELQTWSGDSG